MTTQRDLSIIIPTHNRREVLLQTLGALGRQTYPPERFEVVVVCDGCTDGTAQALQAFTTSYLLQVIEQPAQGPAAARNRGAASAHGQVLLFLDDDIEAFPVLVETHAGVHTGQAGRVGIGYILPVRQWQEDYLRSELHIWWEEKYSLMRRPGYRFSYTNLLTGNFSISVDLFTRLTGFDPGLHCHEDYEFGLRLLRAGAEFVFVPQAAGCHHESIRENRVFQRKMEEGQADLQLISRYPELWPFTWIGMSNGNGGRFWRRMYPLTFNQPALGDWLARWLMGYLHLLEALHLPGRWRRLVESLLTYWYLRGAGAALPGSPSWEAFFQQPRPESDWKPVVIDLDLAGGLEAAEERLDQQRPDGVTIYYQDRLIGQIDPDPRLERLRGAHLRPLLRERFGWEMVKAVAPDCIDRSTVNGKLLAGMYEHFSREVS